MMRFKAALDKPQNPFVAYVAYVKTATAISTPKCVYRAVYITTLLYRCEAWTIYIHHLKSLEAVHVRCQVVRWLEHVICMPSHRFPHKVFTASYTLVNVVLVGRRNPSKMKDEDQTEQVSYQLKELPAATSGILAPHRELSSLKTSARNIVQRNVQRGMPLLFPPVLLLYARSATATVKPGSDSSVSKRLTNRRRLSSQDTMDHQDKQVVIVVVVLSWAIITVTVIDNNKCNDSGVVLMIIWYQEQ